MNDKGSGGKSGDNMKRALWLWRMMRALSAAPLPVQIVVVVGVLYVVFKVMGVLSTLLLWLLGLAVIAIGLMALWGALTKGKSK
jgi:hypothetical protein